MKESDVNHEKYGNDRNFDILKELQSIGMKTETEMMK
jgi:hypothetical protein